MKKGDLITNLHGETLKIIGWRFYPAYPVFPEGIDESNWDRDIISNTIMISIVTGKKRLAIVQLRHINLWIVYKLKFIHYDELKDIRKSHLHGNKYHS